MNTNWVIAGQPDGATPIIGNIYEIRHSRKGTFTGRIMSVDGEWAKVERLEGEIHWASVEYNLLVGSKPEVVSIRACLSYLIELEPATVLSVEADVALQKVSTS